MLTASLLGRPDPQLKAWNGAKLKLLNAHAYTLMFPSNQQAFKKNDRDLHLIAVYHRASVTDPTWNSGQRISSDVFNVHGQNR